MAKRRECTIDGCDKSVLALGYCNKHYLRWRRHGDPLGGGTEYGKPYEFALMAAKYESDDCLQWPYATDIYGYGRINNTGAHRIVCEIAHGSPPTPSHEAAHSCGNGHLGCVNANHLRWATHKENHSDRMAHGTNNAGQKCGSAKLTETDVLQIRRRWKSGQTKASLSRMFGVADATIRHIIARRTWRHLE